MIHSQDVNIPDKYENLFSSQKDLPFNFVSNFFIGITTKSFMRSPFWCQACQHYSMACRNSFFLILGILGSLNRGLRRLFLCNYCVIAFYVACCMALTLFICGDVELNPGLKNTKSSYSFSLCHWNLNSFPVHDFSKLSLIKAYNTHHTFNMICISESYLDSSYADDDPQLNLKDFTLIREDNLNNCKRGGVSIYFKSIWLFVQ